MLNSSLKTSRSGFDALTLLALTGEFNEVRDYEHYLLYLDSGSKKDLNVAFESAVPSIRKFLGNIRKEGFPQSEFISIIAWAYHEEIKRKKIVAENGPDSYAAALRWVCFRSCKAHLTKTRSGRLIPKHHIWYCCPLPYGYIPDQVDMEHKIFLEEIPKMVALNVLPRIRFKKTIYNKACRQILFNLLTNQKNFTVQISYLFDIKTDTVKFLVDHVKVQVKNYIYEFRSLFNSHIMEDWREVFNILDFEEHENTY